MPSPSLEFLETHEIVRAGAGAGKTYTLTHKVASLASEFEKKEGRLPRVIVTTFTRKATGELRERLMNLALEEKPALIDFINSRSHLVVSTIHGVMDLYLKRFGSHICVDPGYRIISAVEAGKIARQVVRQIVLGEPKFADLLESFQFNRLVQIVRRLDAIHHEAPNAKPFTVADFEHLFKQKALSVAAKLEEAAARILEETTSATWTEMAKAYGELAAILVKERWSLNRQHYLEAFDAMKPARKPSRGALPVNEETIELAKAAREEAAEFREATFDPEAWHLFAANYLIIEEIGALFHDAFKKRKLEAGSIEISDLEHLAMACIREYPASAEAFWKEWDYWLIDEYQDTSPFQVELLKKLTGDRPNFVVGDPQQSIYLFRGARSEVFGHRENEIKRAGGTGHLLTVNRRSDPELLLFFNDFFSHFAPPFQPMKPHFEDGESLDPSKTVATFYIGETLDTDDQDAAKNEHELLAIVEHVQKLLDNGARPEDICVLARTNAVLLQVALRLANVNLPTHVHAASGFYDRRETRDALAFLKFLINPHDNFNTVELLRSPWFKVPDAALSSCARKRPSSLWNALKESVPSTNDDASLPRLQNYLERASREGLTEVFKRGLIEAGFVDLSHRHDVSGRRESNIWKLISRLQQEESKPSFNPLAFVNSSRAEIQIATGDSGGNAEGDAVAAVEPNRINLMTVHASKGLEFKHVIVPRMEQRARLTTFEDFTFDESAGRWALRVPYGDDRQMTGSLPEANWLASFQAQELQEHARVLYVALTRAIESVFLSWTGPAGKNSWAAMIGLDLSLGDHQTTSYRYEVVTGEPKPRVAPSVPVEVVVPRPPYSPAKLTGPASISVTDLLSRSADARLTSTVNTDEGSHRRVTDLLELASRGSAVHRLMEVLKYPAPDAFASLIAKWFPGDEARVFKAINFVRETAVPPLLEIIANGEVEWSFSATYEGLLIEGQIDLWGLSPSGDAWIIDYKTGAPAGRDKAFRQMSIYAFALRQSGRIPNTTRIRLAAVYPFAREIFIEDEPSPSALASYLGRG